MEESRLDNELERIYAKLPFLWNEYNFHSDISPEIMEFTIEKIREERARLQALGQDSSLEAVIANLRGGRK